MSDIRTFTRYEATHLVDYLLINENGQAGTYSMGRTLDVSKCGLQLETVIPLNPKQKIQISINLDGEILDLKGEIIHCRFYRGRYLSGIAFQPTSSDSAQAISRYIKYFQRRKEKQ